MADQRDQNQPDTVTGKRVAAVSTSESGRLPTLAIILIGAISALWGFNWPAMKFVVGELTPWTFRVLCVYGAGSTLLMIAWLSGEKVALERGEVRPLILTALFAVTGWHMLTAFGLTIVGGGPWCNYCLYYASLGNDFERNFPRVSA